MGWLAHHTVFFSFLAASLSVLTLLVVTKQREAMNCCIMLLAGQLVGQVSITMYDPPGSLAAAMVLDMVACVYFMWPWVRQLWTHWRMRRLQPAAPPTWRLMMFFIAYTVCLIHVEFAEKYAARQVAEVVLLYEYGLKLNVAMAMLLACNAWPGAHHVAHRLSRNLQYSRVSVGGLGRK